MLFLYVIVCVMIEDVFSVDVMVSWVMWSDVDGADAIKAVIRIDGYRLFKMLLFVFVDMILFVDVFVGKLIKM